MSTLEYPPEDREPTPAGAPQTEAVEETYADMWCRCAIQARLDGADEPHWYYEHGHWWCSVPECHDVADDPPTVPGLIPCQPVWPWHPAEHPGMAALAIEQWELEQRLAEGGPASRP
jgi:hypothetical protein